MLDFASPKISYEQVGENLGRFAVEPLARGFGYTFGNSLRRVLLSSLEGAAISAVRITGVEHEFSTVPHVKEDVTDIILNLKKVVFVLHGETEDAEIRLMKEGQGAITAGDIQAPANVEIMNAGAYIASLEEGGALEMLLKVRRGRGYVSADDNKESQAPLGTIPIDSIFSPVIRVAYAVEPARVGQRTDFDKLTLEIETNGAVHPREAVAKAAGILRENLLIFVDEGEAGLAGEGARAEAETAVVDEAARSDHDDTPIEDLELGVRSFNCLKREGVETVGDLVARSSAELMNIPNFGRKSIEEVRERLTRFGLTLRGE